jgi:hypothetical protein
MAYSSVILITFVCHLLFLREGFFVEPFFCSMITLDKSESHLERGETKIENKTQINKRIPSDLPRGFNLIIVYKFGE